MNIQTAYPVFEASQVLTSSQLNELTGYLEEQDRLTRRALSGIGVVCGFDVDAEGDTVSISKGVAVTSEGFLICSEAQAYNRVRSYFVPVPTAEEAAEDEISEAQYPFLFPDGEDQLPVFELLDTDFAPAPGEADPEPLTDAFLAGKTVMLFLECRLESLKNCDINDCSDKGAERRFTLRRLLITRAQADAMIAQEAAIANRPVDRNTHPRNDLPFIRVEKLALARTGVDSYVGLLFRVLTIALKLAGDLPQALRDSHAAYNYLLDDVFADGEEVFPDTYFSNVWGQLALNLFMAQYFYDYMRDVAMAYNEFVEAAACFEVECLPDPDRFPKHVLLGDATGALDAFTTTFPTDADVLSFNPLTASTGAGLQTRPTARRTHFIPSPAAENQPRLADVRALFLRMHLLALTYRTQGLMQAPIRLTPSRWREAPLYERAIPFYYTFTRDSDIFRNWSPRKTKVRRLNTVYSYRFSIPDNEHPLHFRLDDQDFIRVEGIIGKPLGSTMAELIAYKQMLGLSFSIEPVHMKLAAGPNDQVGAVLDKTAASTAMAAVRKLLLCRLSDLDFIFLVLIGAIFTFLVFLVRQLGKTIPTPRPGRVDGPGDLTFGNLPGSPRDDITVDLERGPIVATPFLDVATAARFRVDLSPEAEVKLKIDSDILRKELKTTVFERGDIVAKLNPDAKEGSAASVFAKVENEAGGGNLFDRTRDFVKEQGGDDAAVRRNYAVIAPMAHAIQLMDALTIDGIADFDEKEFDKAYRGLANSLENHANVFSKLPAQSDSEAKDQRQIAAAANTVTSQAGVFAAANIRTELTAAIQGLFESLTLKGYAKRHPGLEHHAGVPVGGTLILAYVSLADVIQQIGPIRNRLEVPVEGLTASLAPAAGAEIALQGAIQDLAAATADRTEDPLDQFVILADFCLPYQCCDADCSDVVLSERILADPFGENVDPELMVVPPLDGDVSGVPRPRRPISDDLIGRDVPRPGRRPFVVGNFARRGMTTPFERFTPDPDGDVVVQPRREVADAVVFGIVGVQRRGRRERVVVPLSGSRVVFTAANGREQSQATENGKFKIAVPAGPIKIRGTSPGHRAVGQSLTLKPGEERELTLLVAPTG